jgi:cytidine deaminase
MCPDELEPQDCELLAAAIEARHNAYSPYSRFAVGAAVRTTAGEVFTGVNVENASYGLTVCAERNAVAAAVAGGMKPGELAAVAIVADTEEPPTPCGACRQVLAEFAGPDCLVISESMREERVGAWQLAELLPEVFEL